MIAKRCEVQYKFMRYFRVFMVFCCPLERLWYTFLLVNKEFIGSYIYVEAQSD